MAMHVHVATVGDTPEAVRDGLRIDFFDAVVLVHTEQTRQHAEQLRLAIEGLAAVYLREVNEFDFHGVAATVMDSIQHHPDENATMAEATRWSRARFTVHMTGGTKIMVAAATLAAFQSKARLFYLPGPKTTDDSSPIERRVDMEMPTHLLTDLPPRPRELLTILRQHAPDGAAVGRLILQEEMGYPNKTNLTNPIKFLAGVGLIETFQQGKDWPVRLTGPGQLVANLDSGIEPKPNPNVHSVHLATVGIRAEPVDQVLAQLAGIGRVVLLHTEGTKENALALKEKYSSSLAIETRCVAPDDLGSCMQAAVATARRYPNARLEFHFTGGTKLMSAALVFAAYILGARLLYLLPPAGGFQDILEVDAPPVGIRGNMRPVDRAALAAFIDAKSDGISGWIQTPTVRLAEIMTKAGSVQMSPGKLRAPLRRLANMGLVESKSDGAVRLTPQGQTLARLEAAWKATGAQSQG